MKIFYKIIIPIFFLGLFAVLSIQYIFTSSFRRALINEEILVITEMATVASHQYIEPLSEAYARGGAVSEYAAQIFTQVKSASVAIFRGKLWDQKSNLIYSNIAYDPGTIRVPAELERALRGEKFGTIRSLDTLDPSEAPFGESANIFIPLRDAQNNVVFVLELFATTDAILAPSYPTINLIRYLIAGISIVVFLFLMFANHFIFLKPIYRLKAGVDAIAKGNLDVPVHIASHDELGELGQGLEYMRLQIKSNLTMLAEKSRNLIKKEEETQRALKQVTQFAARADHERALYLLFLSSIGEGVIIVDIDENISIMNRAAEGILGFKAGEAIGRKFMSSITFVREDKSALDYSFWGELLRRNETRLLPGGVSVAGRSGILVPVMGVNAPIIDAATKEVKGFIITFRDVREERALEEARLSFISLASHQLRTPLTSIKWFSEMMSGGDAGPLTEEQRQFMTYIYQGTIRMIDIVNLLLQIARLEAGRVRIAPEPLDIKKFTNEVIASLKVPLGEKDEHVCIVANPDPPPLIPLDHSILWQVVQNLLTNAIRYSPKGGEIKVSMIQKKESLEYSVRDRGIGIPRAQRGRIFEKFFRADNALVAVPEGSGLGLSLVKQLVDGWGGTIWFESEEGKGTTFFFTIPLTGMKPKAGDVVLSVGNTQGAV